MIDFDRFVFFGETPTEWLQAHLYEPGVVDWWDVAFTLVYTSYFIVPFALAGVLWVRDRPAFLRFTQAPGDPRAGRRSPPTSSSPRRRPGWPREMGLLDGVHRTTVEGWEVLGVGTAGLFSRARRASTWSPPCPRCTPPSRRWSRCSSGVASAVGCGRCWRSIRWRWALTLIATGEHYFFDVLLGWLYAGAVMAGWAWWEHRSTSRRRGRRRAAGASRHQA